MSAHSRKVRPKPRNRDLSRTLLQDAPGRPHYGKQCQEAEDTKSADAWMRANGHAW